MYAFWEGGSKGFNRSDAWSDLDLYLLVDDEKIEGTFTAVEKSLESLSPIEQKYEVRQSPFTGVAQAFYRLRNTSKYLLIDLAILKKSAPDMFVEPKIHGKALFHFNKSNVVKIPAWDDEAWRRKVEDRSIRLKARFRMFNPFVQKELNRGNYLEALDLYYNLTLSSLLESLRLKHNPLHYDFKMRYVHYELPPDVLNRLRELYFVASPAELEEKYHEATRWFVESSGDS